MESPMVGMNLSEMQEAFGKYFREVQDPKQHPAWNFTSLSVEQTREIEQLIFYHLPLSLQAVIRVMRDNNIKILSDLKDITGD